MQKRHLFLHKYGIKHLYAARKEREQTIGHSHANTFRTYPIQYPNQITNCSTDRKIPQQTVQLFLTAALLHIETYKSRSLSTTWILVPPVAHAHDTPSWISRSCRRAVKHKHASTRAHAEGHHSCLYRSYEQNTSRLMRAQSEKCQLTCLDRYAPVLVKHR